MKRTWNPSLWKKSIKVLLGIATIWPIVYLVLFFAAILSIFIIIESPSHTARSRCGYLDQVQLEKKIKNNEVEELIVKPTEILVRSRVGRCEYWASVTQEETREAILKQARELNVDGKPRVPKISGESAPEVFSAGLPTAFIALFAVHTLTIFELLGLLAIYVALAVQNERLDQTMKIVWVVLLCTFGMFTMPVYWYQHVWRATPTAPDTTLSAA